MASIDPLTGALKFYRDDELQKQQEKKKGDVDELNAHFNPQPSKLPIDTRFNLCMEVAEKNECISEAELLELLKNKVHPVCYDGFEPSGRMHIAQGILKCINVNKLVDAGCIFLFWVADWFALLNNKMGGDLEKIKNVGKYFIEIWKAAGMKMSNVKFLWCSDEINKRPHEYWLQVIDIARKNNIPRIRRCATIMGRSEEDDSLSVAQLLYPCMQCTDIFFLKADICQLGLDQRKVNMLAREYCDDVKMKTKPVILSHHMLSGLIEGAEKMSKSDPNSAIFMEDSEDEVKAKIKTAFCPPGIVEKNPCMEYVKFIVFGALKELQIKRKAEHGGDVKYSSYEKLEADYRENKLHPEDLKNGLVNALNTILKPVRDHFKNDPYARDLLALIRSYKVTKSTDAPKA